jgi:uncharacterized protein
VLTLGVLIASAASSVAAEYSPLDCGKAKSAAEKAICKSYTLGQDEARMATLYAIATSLVAMGQRGEIQDAQRAFLQKRESCGARVSCLADAYAARIGELNSVVESVASRGPF